MKFHLAFWSVLVLGQFIFLLALSLGLLVLAHFVSGETIDSPLLGILAAVLSIVGTRPLFNWLEDWVFSL